MIPIINLLIRRNMSLSIEEVVGVEPSRTELNGAILRVADFFGLKTDAKAAQSLVSDEGDPFHHIVVTILYRVAFGRFKVSEAVNVLTGLEIVRPALGCDITRTSPALRVARQFCSEYTYVIADAINQAPLDERKLAEAALVEKLGWTPPLRRS